MAQLFKNIFVLFLFLGLFFGLTFTQTNPKHVSVSGYYKSDGTYVQPYFRTAPNNTNQDNFSTKGNVNPYTGKAGWIEPDGEYNTFYYNTYTYSSKDTINESGNIDLLLKYKNRTYIEDEFGNCTFYLTVQDGRTFNIYDLNDSLVLYLVINHRGDWRIFDSNMIYIKTIFVETEK